MALDLDKIPLVNAAKQAAEKTASGFEENLDSFFSISTLLILALLIVIFAAAIVLRFRKDCDDSKNTGRNSEADKKLNLPRKDEEGQ